MARLRPSPAALARQQIQATIKEVRTRTMASIGIQLCKYMKYKISVVVTYASIAPAPLPARGEWTQTPHRGCAACRRVYMCVYMCLYVYSYLYPYLYPYLYLYLCIQICVFTCKFQKYRNCTSVAAARHRRSVVKGSLSLSLYLPIYMVKGSTHRMLEKLSRRKRPIANTNEM